MGGGEENKRSVGGRKGGRTNGGSKDEDEAAGVDMNVEIEE